MAKPKNGSTPQVAIDVTQIKRIKAEEFFVDLVVDGVPFRMGLAAVDIDCLMASLSVLANAYFPRVGGWNIYSMEGKLLKSVTTIDFIARVTELTPLKVDPAKKDGVTKGFIPVVQPTSEAFKKLMEQSKREGRIQ